MRLTTFTNLGLRTLMHLAKLPASQLSSVPEISKVYNISQNNMVKVAAKLKKHGYITAIRGENGGILLALPQDKISIGQVIRNLENHLDVIDCMASHYQLMPSCKLKKALSKSIEAF
jgi:Rrf2 family nitric oxide-sensitive transcriptional repressor